MNCKRQFLNGTQWYLVSAVKKNLLSQFPQIAFRKISPRQSLAPNVMVITLKYREKGDGCSSWWDKKINNLSIDAPFFKSNTTLTSHLIRPRDDIDEAMLERITEQD